MSPPGSIEPAAPFVGRGRPDLLEQAETVGVEMAAGLVEVELEQEAGVVVPGVGAHQPQAEKFHGGKTLDQHFAQGRPPGQGQPLVPEQFGLVHGDDGPDAQVQRELGIVRVEALVGRFVEEHAGVLGKG